MGKATQDLVNEHVYIVRALSIMEKIIIDKDMDKDKKLQYFNDIIYFLKMFADKCHHGKEEVILFGELVNKGIKKEDGPIGNMLTDHAHGREYIKMMTEAIDNKDLDNFSMAAKKYIELLRFHIKKEDDALFITADQILDDFAQDNLYKKFEDYEKNVIGYEVHSELLSLINKLSIEFDVK